MGLGGRRILEFLDQDINGNNLKIKENIKNIQEICNFQFF